MCVGDTSQLRSCRGRVDVSGHQTRFLLGPCGVNLLPSLHDLRVLWCALERKLTQEQRGISAATAVDWQRNRLKDGHVLQSACMPGHLHPDRRQLALAT
jgi:hypothetical protein